MFNNTYEEIRKAQNNDKEAMDNLVKNNLGLVYNIAKRFMGRGVELEDLIQIGTIGLIKSIKKFEIYFWYQLLLQVALCFRYISNIYIHLIFHFHHCSSFSFSINTSGRAPRYSGNSAYSHYCIFCKVRCR